MNPDKKHNISPPSKYWGLYGTLLISFLIIILFSLISEVLFFSAYIIQKIWISNCSFNEFVNNFKSTGFHYSLSLIIFLPLCVYLISLLVSLKSDNTFIDYVGLKHFSTKQISAWILVFILFYLLSEVSVRLLNQPALSDRSIYLLNSACSIPLWIVTTSLVAPISEEIIFRGFMFTGFKESRVGAFGAIVLSSILWSTFHSFGNYYEAVHIFIFGIILGYSRFISKSIYPAIILHAITHTIESLKVIL